MWICNDGFGEALGGRSFVLRNICYFAILEEQSASAGEASTYCSTYLVKKIDSETMLTLELATLILAEF